MIPWTAQEISLLIGLWPTASAAQISKWLNRSRGSVCGKAMRLRSDGVLPAELEKHFEVNPAVQTRPGFRQETGDVSQSGKADATDRCHRAAAGNAALLAARTRRRSMPLAARRRAPGRDELFCGGDAVPGRCYCAHHLRMARCDSGLPQSDRCDKRLLQPSH